MTSPRVGILKGSMEQGWTFHSRKTGKGARIFIRFPDLSLLLEGVVTKMPLWNIGRASNIPLKICLQ